MSAARAPEEVAAVVSASDAFVFEEEMARAQKDLFLSSFIYAFADIREACVLGLSKIPFALLALEDDAMTTSQILNGAPHVHDPFAEGSTAGFSLQDLAFCMLRITSKFGLGDGESYLLGEGEAPAASGRQEGEKKASDFIKDQELILRNIDLSIRAFLGDDTAAPAGRSRGILGTDYGLTYIQRFFDLVYEGAKTDDNYRAVLDMFQGTTDYRKTGYGEQDTVFAAPFLKVISSVAKDRELFGKDQAKIVWINDSKNNAELVYAITANKDLKRITVVFRGSVDGKDWVGNLDLGSALDPNPIQEDYEGKKDTVEIRKGFWRFLLNPRADNGRNKYDEIADKVHEYGRELGGEDYQLEVTGHSLGGVLATLFGFYASTDARFNRHHRVEVRTFGSPIPGKVSFAAAFRHQEDAGRLSHARFVMARDPVPQMRFLDKHYAHTGHRIELSTDKDAAPRVSYVDLRELGTWKNYVNQNSLTSFLLNLSAAHKLMLNHSVLTYDEALGQYTVSRNSATEHNPKPEALRTFGGYFGLIGVVFFLLLAQYMVFPKD